MLVNHIFFPFPCPLACLVINPWGMINQSLSPADEIFPSRRHIKRPSYIMAAWPQGAEMKYWQFNKEFLFPSISLCPCAVCVFVCLEVVYGEIEEKRRETGKNRHKERGNDEAKCFPFRGYSHKNGSVLNNQLLIDFICLKISPNFCMWTFLVFLLLFTINKCSFSWKCKLLRSWNDFPFQQLTHENNVITNSQISI